jgi:hypothetical protein
MMIWRSTTLKNQRHHLTTRVIVLSRRLEQRRTVPVEEDYITGGDESRLV